MATLLTWDGGALPNTVGTVSLDAADGIPAPPGILIESSDGAAVARWDIAPNPVVALRFYFRTPAAWASSSVLLAIMRQNTSQYLVGVSFSGSTSPGQFRLTKMGGGTVLQSPTNTLSEDTEYRVELHYDKTNTRARAAIFEMNTNLPLWESSWQTDPIWTEDIIRLELGRPNVSPNTFPFIVDSVMVTDTVANYIGRHAGDSGSGPPPDPNFPLEWSGGTLPPFLGSNVTLDETWGIPSSPSVRIAQQPSSGAYVNYVHDAASMEIAARCYMRMPASWASSAWGLINLRPTPSTLVASLTLGGSGQPGQIRLGRTGGATVIQSPANTMSANQVYRFEIRYNANFQQARVAVFSQGGNTPLWDSDWQSHTDFSQPIGLTQFGRVTQSPTAPAFNLDGLYVNNSSVEWIGRIDGDDPVGAIVKVWNGTSLVTATAVKVATTQGGGLVNVTKTFVVG